MLDFEKTLFAFVNCCLRLKNIRYLQPKSNIKTILQGLVNSMNVGSAKTLFKMYSLF